MEENLSKLAYKLRQDVVQMIVNGKGGHIGGDMSVMECMVALYFKEMNVTPENFNSKDHDRFMLSKGHCVESLYAVLAHKGFFSREELLRDFSQFGSKFIGHPNNKLLGIEMNSGALGHGLPVAVGMALAQKMDKASNRVYVVMGDGEQAEGSVWEAAMSGAHYKLDNLCAVIDRNHLQISGDTEDVMALENFPAKWAAFGWNVIEVENGNSIEQLLEAFARARQTKDQPSVIIMHTTKGKGSSIMENKASWHHHLPNEEEFAQIMSDLKKAEENA